MCNVDIILKTVADHAGITVRGLKNKDNSRKLTVYRSLAFRLIKIHEPALTGVECARLLNKCGSMSDKYKKHFEYKIVKPEYRRIYHELRCLLLDLKINNNV